YLHAKTLFTDRINSLRERTFNSDNAQNLLVSAHPSIVLSILFGSRGNRWYRAHAVKPSDHRQIPFDSFGMRLSLFTQFASAQTIRGIRISASRRTEKLA